MEPALLLGPGGSCRRRRRRIPHHPVGPSSSRWVVASAVVEAQPHLRGEGEAVAEGEEAVAELEVQALALQAVRWCAVVVGGPFRQGDAGEQGVCAAGGGPTHSLGQRQGGPQIRVWLLPPGEGTGEAPIP